MINFQVSSGGTLNHAQRTAQAAEDGQKWQQQAQNFQEVAKEQQARRKQKAFATKTNKTSATSATSAVGLSRFDENVQNYDDFGGDYALQHFDDAAAERFDMKDDMQKFVRPPSINNKELEKDALWDTSKEVLNILDQTDASPSLKKRAARLLQEEQKIKSIMAGYQNALIFS